jgi:hypothetical protein
MKTGLALDRKSGTKFQNFIQVKVVPSLDSIGAGTHVPGFLRYLKSGGFEYYNACVHLESAISSLA